MYLETSTDSDNTGEDFFIHFADSEDFREEEYLEGKEAQGIFNSFYLRKKSTADRFSYLKIIGGSKEKIIPLDYKFLKDIFEISLNFLPVENNENLYQTCLTEDQFNLIKNSNIKKMFLRANILNMDGTPARHVLLQCLASGVFGSTIVGMQHDPTPEPSGADYTVILNITAQLENYFKKIMKLTIVNIPIIYQTSLFEKLKLNDAGYITKAITDLTNYYTKTDVDNLINAIHTLDIQIVTELPTENISHTTIYLKGTETSGTNDYEEWIYTVNNSWELIGSTAVDLTGYLKTKDADKGYLQKKTGSEMAALADINTADINNNGMIVLCTQPYTGTNYHYQQGHIYILTIYAEQGAIESIGWRDITSTYYQLPTASAETLGGVKVGKTEGSGIKIDKNGEISVDPAVYLSIKDIHPILERKIEYIGDGVNTSFTFTAEPYCITDFYVCDKKTGEEVYPNIKKDNYDKTMIITFTKPPKASEYVLHYSIGICLDNSGPR